MRFIFNILFCISALLSVKMAFAQNDLDSVNTFRATIDPSSKTDIIISTYEQNQTLTAKKLSEVIEQAVKANPAQKEFNIVIPTDKGQSRLITRLQGDINKALQQGIIINLVPFDLAAAKLAAQRNQTQPSLNIDGNNMAIDQNETPKEKNLRNTVATTRDTLRHFYQDAKSVEFRGLIVATVLAGAGGTVLGPSWIFATDVPVSYQITSGFVSTVLLYWLPNKTSSIASLYKLSYEYVRTARYMLPTLLSKDYVVPPATKRGQALSTAFTGGLVLSYGLQTILQGTAMGFNNVMSSDYQSVLLWNSLMIGAASTPWSSLTHKLRKSTSIAKEWISGGRTLHILGVGFLAVNMPGLTESYMLGYSLNWAQQLALLTGGIGILANRYAVPFINKDRSTIESSWFGSLNRGLESISNNFRQITARFHSNSTTTETTSPKSFRPGSCGKYLTI